jgi:3-hydroxyisobutyrate dehydrogenase-like beta-hydroxyacid dehydrogenase
MRVAFLGLGQMGAAMARRLEGADFDLTVYNRTPAPTEEFAACGVRIAVSPADAADGADVVLTMLTDGAAVEAVVLGQDGVLAGAGPYTSVLAEMSTIDVASSRRIAERAAVTGTRYLRAPVSGNPVAVQTGNLSIIVSGDADALEDVRTVLEAIGPTIFHLGDAEEARVMKLALATMIASSAQTLAEALALGEAHGLGRAQMLEIIRGSAAGSPFVNYKSAPLVADDYTSTFTSRLMQKDLRLIRACAEEVGLPVPLTALVERLVQDCIDQGMGDLDIIALLPRLQHEAGLRAELPTAPGTSGS